jgi:hypothetical protein
MWIRMVIFCSNNASEKRKGTTDQLLVISRPVILCGGRQKNWQNDWWWVGLMVL